MFLLVVFILMYWLRSDADNQEFITVIFLLIFF